MNDPQIRKATLEDIDPAYQIIEDCKNLLASQGMNNWKRYSKEKVNKMIRSDSLFLLLTESEAVGTVKVSEKAPSFYNTQDMNKWEKPSAKATYFTALAVSPKHQSSGYGAILLEYVENYAKENNSNYLRMTMLSKNSALKRYYTKRGFVFAQQRDVSELGLELLFGEKRLN